MLIILNDAELNAVKSAIKSCGSNDAITAFNEVFSKTSGVHGARDPFNDKRIIIEVPEDMVLVIMDIITKNGGDVHRNIKGGFNIAKVPKYLGLFKKISTEIYNRIYR